MIPRQTHGVASLAIAIAALSIAIQSCDSGSDSPSTPADDMGKPFFETSYTIQGDRLVVTYITERITTWSFCAYSSKATTSMPDSLVIDRDTTKSPETVLWSLNHDTLLITETDTNYTDTDSIPYLDQVLYIRLSGSEGLNGRFKQIDTKHLPLEQVPSTSSDTGYFSSPSTDDIQSRFVEYVIEFDGGRGKSWIRALGSWADYTIADWNKYSQDEYDITIRKIDDNTVTETGNINHEEVTRQLVNINPEFKLDGDIRYSSSDSTHKTGIKYSAPTSCPNGVDWYRTFQTSNRKPSAWRLASRSLQGNPPAAPAWNLDHPAPGTFFRP